MFGLFSCIFLVFMFLWGTDVLSWLSVKQRVLPGSCCGFLMDIFSLHCCTVYSFLNTKRNEERKCISFCLKSIIKIKNKKEKLSPYFPQDCPMAPALASHPKLKSSLSKRLLFLLIMLTFSSFILLSYFLWYLYSWKQSMFPYDIMSDTEFSLQNPYLHCIHPYYVLAVIWVS